MADSFTALTRFISQMDGGNINQWGRIMNSAFVELAEEALCGYETIDVTSGNVTLTPLNGLSDNQRPMFLRITGSPGVIRSITLPAATSKTYVIFNLTEPASDIIIKTVSGSGVRLSNAQTPTFVYVDSNAAVVKLLGRSNAIFAGTDWGTFSCSTGATAGDANISVYYSVQGSFATVVVPAFNFTVNAATCILLTSGSFPVAIQYGGPDVQVPCIIVGNSGASVIESIAYLDQSGTDAIRFSASEPGGAGADAYGVGVDRDLAYDLVFNFSVRA